MNTVLHLERKFTTKTETFIINQINLHKKYTPKVCTIRFLNNLPCNAEIITAPKLSYVSGKTKILSYKTKIQLYKKLLKEDFDIIHTHYLSDALFFHNLTKKIKKPKICSLYGYDVTSFPSSYWGIPKLFLKKIFSEYDLFLAMTHDMKNDLLKLGCPEFKIVIHYYGTDVKRFYTVRDYNRKMDNINFLIISNLQPKKGHLFLLEALKNAYKKNQKIKLRIVGEGPGKCKILKYIKENKMGNYVKLTGPVDYASKEHLNLLKNSDVFVHPSVTDSTGDKEGIPGSIVEAMASGLPVISTYHAGIPDIIQHEKTGLLVKEYDVDSLSNYILKLAIDEKLREYLGKNAQFYAIHNLDIFDKEEKLEKIYDRLLQN